MEDDTINGYKRNLACEHRLCGLLCLAIFGPDRPGEFAHAAGFAAARRCLRFLVFKITQ